MSRPKGRRETRIELGAEQVENYVGVPLTEGQRRKLQQLADKVPTESLEDLAARALEAGVDRLLEQDEEPEPPGELMLRDQVALLAHAFENRGKKSVPSSITIPLNSLHRHILDGLTKVLPAMTLEDIIDAVMSKGLERAANENGLVGSRRRTWIAR
jgi:hypothetical protein